ncbi:MAG: Hypoxanthine-guanine phosphoribosyltransferase [Fimbriimonadaceae bacterium]|nr:Hypoxanthine-guanine phosphoribosyltransferase [Fimbriimonadaceae bacterium]
MIADRVDILLSADAIQQRIDQLAAEIRTDYGDNPFLMVVVLKGSFIFAADLARRLPESTQIDFVQVSSYADQKSSSGVVQIRKDLDITVEGKHVLIVEDIVDTGLTLGHLRELFATRKPASLRVVALLNKPDAQAKPAEIEYVGFQIPNEFVVGYGLDYAERYRNLPFVAVLRSE